MNSTPQFVAGERRAVAQGAQLGPGDLRMDAAAQAAVGAGDDIFSADEEGRRIKGDANLFDGFTNPIYVFGLVRGVWLDDAGRQSSRIHRGTRHCPR
jgi:hypothetical protein